MEQIEEVQPAAFNLDIPQPHQLSGINRERLRRLAAVLGPSEDSWPPLSPPASHDEETSQTISEYPLYVIAFYPVQG